MPTTNEIRKAITDQIVAVLKSGSLPPWRKPWRSDPNSGFPINVISGQKYRGINPLLLELASIRQGFTSKFWGTFRQWDQLCCRVMARPKDVAPGQWGTNIIFWKPITKTEKRDDGEETEDKFFVLKQYCVFNADQVSGAEPFRVGASPVTMESPVIAFEAADRAISATGADIRYGGDRAFYPRSEDFIQVPPRGTFTAPEYYETVFHELTHWSEPRLQWEGSRPMAELIAEIGSCFTATELGLPTGQNMTTRCRLEAEERIRTALGMGRRGLPLAVGQHARSRGKSGRSRWVSKRGPASGYVRGPGI
jgi:antirestriction protein ArdC